MKRLTGLVGVAVLGLALLAIAARDTAPPLIDEPMPPLALTAPDGTDWTLADLRGRVVVLNLWATWCPPCREEMPALQRLAEALPDERFAVVGVSVDEDRYLVEEFLRRLTIDFTVVMDPAGEASDRLLAVRAYPETFLIGPDGVLRERILGDQSWDSEEWQARIRALAADG